MELINSDPELGNYYHDAETGISVFEKTKDLDVPRFCAWEGPVEGYKDASRTPWADNAEEAVAFLDFQQFRCSECGKMRARKEKKRWTDQCKDNAPHDWIPITGKKKSQPGRKFNLWLADAQLQEVEDLCAETGNDRASTIRDLIALGLKCRRQMNKFMHTGE